VACGERKKKKGVSRKEKKRFSKDKRGKGVLWCDPDKKTRKHKLAQRTTQKRGGAVLEKRGEPRLCWGKKEKRKSGPNGGEGRGGKPAANRTKEKKKKRGEEGEGKRPYKPLRGVERKGPRSRAQGSRGPFMAKRGKKTALKKKGSVSWARGRISSSKPEPSAGRGRGKEGGIGEKKGTLLWRKKKRGDTLVQEGGKRKDTRILLMKGKKKSAEEGGVRRIGGKANQKGGGFFLIERKKETSQDIRKNKPLPRGGRTLEKEGGRSRDLRLRQRNGCPGVGGGGRGIKKKRVFFGVLPGERINSRKKKQQKKGERKIEKEASVP